MPDIAFNLNDYTTVELTQVGVDIYNAHWAGYDIKPPKVLVAGQPYREQLWSVMAVWGSSMGNGLPVPFKTSLTLHKQARTLDEKLAVATIAPYGPDVSMNTNGDRSGEVLFLGGTYLYKSFRDLVDRAEELPFTVEVIRIYPDAEREYWQVKVGDKTKDVGFWRCTVNECGCLNQIGVFAGPFSCFSCGAPKPAETTPTGGQTPAVPA
jgi:hypothetical protein